MKSIFNCHYLRLCIGVVTVICLTLFSGSILADSKRYPNENDAEYDPPELVQPDPHYLHPMPDPQLNPIDPTPFFEYGEPNDTMDEARNLSTSRTRTAYIFYINHAYDEDWYVLESPADSQGDDPYSGFIQFTLDACSEMRRDHFKLALFAPAAGPEDHALYTISSDHTDTNDNTVWIALKRGARIRIKVSHRSPNISQNYPQPYKLTVTTGIMLDANEPDDERGGAILLTYPDSVTSYLAPVFNGNGDIIGMSDWYYFKHEECQKEAVMVEHDIDVELYDEWRKIPIGFMEEDDEDSIGNFKDIGQWKCIDDVWGELCDARPVFVRITHPGYRTPDRLAHGKGFVPLNYYKPYTISFMNMGNTLVGACGLGCPDSESP